MFSNDTSAEDFIKLWGNGYVESWDAYDRHYYYDVLDLITVQPVKRGLAVEIGAGGGLFTYPLCAKFDSVIAVDVVPEMPEVLRSRANLVWMQRINKQFNLAGIESEAADLIFSFGTFCHFSFEACASYLSDIRRVLKPAGVALIMFGNWKRHPGSMGSFFPHAFVGHQLPGTWFYQDESTVGFLAEQSGLTFEDAWPHFRDTMAKMMVRK